MVDLSSGVEGNEDVFLSGSLEAREDGGEKGLGVAALSGD